MSLFQSLIRVIIADHQPLIRSGLGSFLMVYNELQLVGEAQDSEELLQLCKLVEPDVAIIDLDIPDKDGLQLTNIIHHRWPSIRIILLCENPKDERITRSMQAGASGFLTKDICADDLARAIHEISLPVKSDSKRPRKEFIQIQTQESPEDHQPPEYVSLEQEMAAAGKIQADILPAKAPIIQGWDLYATLHPARETSGDFFDFIPLPNGNWGIIIADVTDKGMGAALFMTLSSTLMRTYAIQYPTLPGLVVSTVNNRILADTRGDMFVTAVYGVLEPATGRFRYVNAGHNPPFMISCKKGKPFDSLRPTGMALGVVKNTHWGQKIVRFAPGDLLALYTDGITDAQDQQGRFFGEQRLLQMIRSHQGRSVDKICKDVLEEVHQFTGGSHFHDDIAIMMISRK